jgi:predicted DNA-binding ribbon-helix-helix protein
MGRPSTPDSLIHNGVFITILIKTEHKKMLKELAARDDSSMNRIIRKLIEKEYENLKISSIFEH